MRQRWRALVCHALLGGLLASVGLAWMAQDEREGASESRLFTAQSQEVRPGPPEAGSSRLGRVATRNPRVVTVMADGDARRVATEAPTVEGALDAAGVEADADDRVSPPPGAPVQAGMTVEVARVEVTERTRTEAVDFDTVERPSDEFTTGVRREQQAGREGLVEVIEEVVLVDGEVESRTRVGARVRREPDDRVVLVGTSDAGGETGSADSEPEPTNLARRQSAGTGSSASSSPDSPSPSATEEAAAEPAPSPSGSAQPAAPEPAPAEEPPAQEATGNTQEGTASRYADRFDGQATASGEPYDPDALTAAHRELPMGTVVTVTNTATGQSVRVRINDRGPHVSGRVIDLSRAAWNRVASPSAGLVHVRLEW